MTPAEKLGYKIGDRFVVRGSDEFTDGSIVQLAYDDGSESPFFRLINGRCKLNNATYKSDVAHCDLISVKKLRKTK